MNSYLNAFMRYCLQVILIAIPLIAATSWPVQAQSARDKYPTCFEGLPDEDCFTCDGLTSLQCAQNKQFLCKKGYYDSKVCSVTESFIQAQGNPPPINAVVTATPPKTTTPTTPTSTTQTPIPPVSPKGGSNKNLVQIPFGPYSAQLQVNGKTGQKVSCEATTGQSIQELKDEIRTKFGVDFQGPWPAAYLKGACDKFAEISGTRYFDLIHFDKPYEQSIFPVILSTCGNSHVEGTRRVFTGPCGTDQLNKVILLHEIGHVLYHTSPEISTRMLAARVTDRGKPYPNGGATKYGDLPGPCTGSDAAPQNEDLADSVSYYLNPNATEMTATSCSSGRKPFADKSSAHYQYITELLGDYDGN